MIPQVKKKKKKKRFSVNIKKLIDYKRLLILSVFALFLLQATYMAYSTQYGIPPDERYHFSFITLYSSNLNILPTLKSQEGYFFLGDVIRNPSYLYHYILGKAVLVTGITNEREAMKIVILRFANIIIACLSLVVFLKLIKNITKSFWVIFMSLFALTNTLMFVFLSASINYDNLVVLASLISFFILIKLFEETNLSRFIIFLTTLMLSSVIKVSFLPLFVIELIILGIIILRKYDKNRSPLDFLNQPKLRRFKVSRGTIIRSIILIVFLFVSSYLSFERYGINYLTYGSITPSCDQIHTIEECSRSGIYVRNKKIRSSGKTYNMSYTRYTTTWGRIMITRTFGIFGHKSIVPARSMSLFLPIFIILAFVSFSRYFTLKHKKIIILTTIFISYTLILIFFVNYKTYHISGNPGLAVQGRYLFPVLPLMYLVAFFYLEKLLSMNKFLKWAFTATFLIVFAYSSLPTYIIKTDKTWYNNNILMKINMDLKERLLSGT